MSLIVLALQSRAYIVLVLVYSIIADIIFMFGYLLHKNIDREAQQRPKGFKNIRNKERLENIKLSNSNLAAVSGAGQS